MITLTSPTLLFTATDEQTVAQAVLALLQQQLCAVPHTQIQEVPYSCMAPDCRKLKQQQHHAAYWIAPTKQQYILDDLQTIFEVTPFARSINDPCFFIITQAELLTPTCANKLLKLLEEPTEGYYFILQTTHSDKLLPTIVSRCIVKTLHAEHGATNHPLLSFFYPILQKERALEFEQTLKKSGVNQISALELTQQLHTRFIQEQLNASRLHTTLSLERTIYLKTAISLLQKTILMPPQAGSAELYFKNLFLQFLTTA